jgi:ribosomal protein L7/L12
MSNEKIIEKIKQMTILELDNLIQELKHAFNLDDSGDFKEYSQLTEDILKLTNKEIVSIITSAEEAFGVKAGTSLGSGAATTEGDSAAPAEKSHYSLSIKGFKLEASKKVEFIKVLRGQKPTIGISEAMKIFDEIATGGQTFTVFDNLSKEECGPVQKALEPYCEVILK